jgi:kynurenine formamidase
MIMGVDQDMLDALRTARVYDLSVELFAGMPHAWTEPPFVFSLLRSHKGTPGADRDSSAACFFGMGGHTGTHIDAFGHMAEKGGAFKGKGSVFDNESYKEGAAIGSIEETPAIIRRGILLDIPLVKGVDVLGPAEAISAADLEAAERLENVKVAKDDVVLIRTGWMHWWTKDAGQYNAPDDKIPGVAVSAGKWLTDKKASFTGSDTPNYEKAGQTRKRPVRSLLLHKVDIQIMGNMYLDEIARDRIYEFIFMAIPLKIRGGTASPIRPVAVVCQ